MTCSRMQAQPWGLGLQSFFAVFVPGCLTAPDMAFPFVDFQYLSDLFKQPWVTPWQALGQVLVDGGFGNSEMLGSGADRRTRLDHVHSHFAGSSVDMVCHRIPPMLCATGKSYACFQPDMP